LTAPFNTPFYNHCEPSACGTPCSGFWSYDQYADANTGAISSWDTAQSNYSSFCYSNTGYVDSTAGLHGGYWGVGGSSSTHYNFFFTYKWTVNAAFYASDLNEAAQVYFIANIWDTSTASNVYGPVDFYPPALDPSWGPFTDNLCSQAFNSNVTLSLAGNSVYQPRIQVYVWVESGANDHFPYGEANVDLTNYDSTCGDTNGATLNGISLWGDGSGSPGITDELSGPNTGGGSMPTVAVTLGAVNQTSG
jgi:hypothetical protein